MSEQSETLKARTMRLAVDVCELLKVLPSWEPGPTIRRQLAKSATSVALNYRASWRARSRAEFISKLGTVAEESDESLGWLEFIASARLLPASRELLRVTEEARELVAIFSASVGTARRQYRTSGRP
jgi:four helix bundle protein